MTKSILLVSILSALSTTAFAEHNTARLGIEYRDGSHGGQDATAYSLSVGQEFNKNFAGDVRARVKLNDDDTNDTRVEAGLTSKVGIGDLSPYVRTALGEKFNGENNYTYWSIEPGLKYTVLPGLSVKGAVRFRDAFSDSIVDSTRTWRIGAEYDLTKNSSLALNVDKVIGDSEYIAAGLTYGIKF